MSHITITVELWEVLEALGDHELLEEVEARGFADEAKPTPEPVSELVEAVEAFHDTEGHPCALCWCLHPVCRKHPRGYEQAREQWGRGR